MATKYAVAQLPDGRVRYNDGSISNAPMSASNKTTVNKSSQPSPQIPPQVGNFQDTGMNQDIVNKYDANLAAFNQASDRYIKDLLSQAKGDRDAAIAILTRDHEQALGGNDAQRAEFLESVADGLEKQIGKIPYDYQVGVTRTNEDTARSTDLINRNKTTVLDRLAEDEKVWKEQFTRDSTQARTGQQEALAQRGILSGTRENAQGLAGQEVNNLETDLTSTLSAYDRALQRERTDVTQGAEDALFDVNRNSTRTLEDLKTGARRGAQEVGDQYTDGKKAAESQYARIKKQLDYEKEMSKLRNKTYAASV